MKNKIAILGSTGSIGKTLLDILLKDRRNIEIILLTANKDHNTLYSQAKKFNENSIVLKSALNLYSVRFTLSAAFS